MDDPFSVYCLFSDREGVIKSLKRYEILDPQKYQVYIVAHEGSYVEKYHLMVRITFIAENGSKCGILLAARRRVIIERYVDPGNDSVSDNIYENILE